MTVPKIDYTAIRFPSDELSIERLRQAFPHAFDVEVPDNHPEAVTLRGHGLRQDDRLGRRLSLDRDIGVIVDSERIVALTTFRRALGSDEPESDREDGLIEDYVSLGLASGSHEAQELCRNIKAQAVTQARMYERRSR